MLKNGFRKRLVVLLAGISLGVFPMMVRSTADVTDAPSLDFLEFLGSWETNEGEWLDPLHLLEEVDAESRQTIVEDGGND